MGFIQILYKEPNLRFDCLICSKYSSLPSNIGGVKALKIHCKTNNHVKQLKKVHEDESLSPVKMQNSPPKSYTCVCDLSNFNNAHNKICNKCK